MAEPIIIVKENGLVIEVKFKGGDPGPLNPQKLDHDHVILRWPENQMSSMALSEVVIDKPAGNSPQFEVRIQAKESPEQTAS